MKLLFLLSFIFSVTQAARTKCPKKILKAPEGGEFTSPGYTAGRYPNGVTCEYVIKAKKGFYLHLKFLYFDVEGLISDGRKTDYVQVADGRPKNRLREQYYYGRKKTPFSFVSKTNRIYLKFVSDGDFGFKGFRATYKAIKHNYNRCVIPDVANGKLSCHTFEDGLADKCNVTCNTNHTLLGNKTITCKDEQFTNGTSCGLIPEIAQKCDEDIATCPYTIDEVVRYYLSREVLENATEEQVTANLETMKNGIKIDPAKGRSVSSIRVTCLPIICAYNSNGVRAVACKTYTSRKLNQKLRGHQITIACYHCQVRKCGVIVVPFG